jgi:hypothetical protein
MWGVERPSRRSFNMEAFCIRLLFFFLVKDKRGGG